MHPYIALIIFMSAPIYIALIIFMSAPIYIERALIIFMSAPIYIYIYIALIIFYNTTETQIIIIDPLQHYIHIIEC